MAPKFQVTESDAIDVVEIAINRHNSDLTTKAMALTALLKLSSRFQACSDTFPRLTHETFAQKLYKTFESHKRFSKAKLSRSDFTISHYAGDVTYQTELFLDKNKDYVVAEHQGLLSASKCSFVAGLFPPLAEESKLSKFSSIGSRFKQQLLQLLETLNSTSHIT